MKFHITRDSQGSKIFSDDGKELNLCATRISIEASVDEPSHATVELLCVETTAFCEKPNFRVGPYDNVVGVFLADGTLKMLGTEVNFNDCVKELPEHERGGNS